MDVSDSPKQDHRLAVQRRTLRVIGAFKMLKAAMLVLISAGALRFIHRDLEAAVVAVLNHVRADPEGRMFRHLVAWAANVSPHKLEVIAAATGFYAILFSVEGVGLWMAKEWAEWLAVASSVIPMPIEIYEVVRYGHWQRITVLVINVAIVAYLLWVIVGKHRRKKRSDPGVKLET
jgi:uncharacterized membrane protein (DUF2068 family)